MFSVLYAGEMSKLSMVHTSGVAAEKSGPLLAMTWQKHPLSELARVSS